jgi:hypothetical protein
LIFFSLLAAVSVALDLFISKNLIFTGRHPGETEVWSDIYEGAIKAETAVIGSSRAWVMFNSRIIEDSTGSATYNFGINGHNFIMQYFRHLEFLKHNMAPRTIIVSLDIFTLQKRKDLFGYEHFLPFMLWNSDMRKYAMMYEGFSQSEFFVPILRYAGERKSVFRSFKNAFADKKRYREKGFRGMEDEWGGDLNKALAEMKEYVIQFDSATEELFGNFLNECAEKNIRVVLVYAPEYIEGQKFVKNRSGAFDKFNAFSKDHGIVFLDYSKDEISFDRSLFYNAGHLNALGADIFSAKLASDLKNLGIR